MLNRLCYLPSGQNGWSAFNNKLVKILNFMGSRNEVRKEMSTYCRQNFHKHFQMFILIEILLAFVPNGVIFYSVKPGYTAPITCKLLTGMMMIAHTGFVTEDITFDHILDNILCMFCTLIWIISVMYWAATNISNKISLKFVPKGPINYKSSLRGLGRWINHLLPMWWSILMFMLLYDSWCISLI